MRAKVSRWADVHWPFLGVVMLIALLGVYNLHSAAAARDSSLYLTQLIWLGLGFGVAGLLLIPDYRVSETFAYAFYAVVCLLLVAVLVQGHAAGGAQRWLRLGPINFQPSEFAKLATVFCLARYFSKRPRTSGYSLRALFQPLNPTRPMVVAAAVLLAWNKPFLQDPVGELARTVRGKVGLQVLGLDDLLWFRIGMILGALVMTALAMYLIVRIERSQALFNPWPSGKLKRLMVLSAALGMSVLFWVIWQWDAPWMRDPVGYMLKHLYEEAGPQGALATLQEGYIFRGFLLGIGAIYLIASLVHVRQRAKTFLEMMVAPIDLLMIPAAMVLVQPDLGTAGVIILVGMTMILVVGVRFRSLVILGALGIVSAGFAWFGLLKDYQKRRILTFLDPENDIQGAGWNAVQSMIAVGSGQWFGKGHKGGTQTQLSFLPEQHTDFAFSVWGEEMGFIGCAVLIMLYLVLISIAFMIAVEARDRYGSLLAAGFTAVILWQTLINIAMVVGAFPVVGLTLPLFSYGGSSVLTIGVGIGMLLNIYMRRRPH